MVQVTSYGGLTPMRVLLYLLLPVALFAADRQGSDHPAD
jgi:hypothetical protein